MDIKKINLPKSYCSIQDELNEAIRGMCVGIDRKKDDVIKAKLKELGIQLDIEMERKRKFPRFTVEKQGLEETLWFDDGSTHGQRVITFVQMNTSYYEDMTCGIKVEYSYY